MLLFFLHSRCSVALWLALGRGSLHDRWDQLGIVELSWRLWRFWATWFPERLCLSFGRCFGHKAFWDRRREQSRTWVTRQIWRPFPFELLFQGRFSSSKAVVDPNLKPGSGFWRSYCHLQSPEKGNTTKLLMFQRETETPSISSKGKKTQNLRKLPKLPSWADQLPVDRFFISIWGWLSARRWQWPLTLTNSCQSHLGEPGPGGWMDERGNGRLWRIGFLLSQVFCLFLGVSETLSGWPISRDRRLLERCEQELLVKTTIQVISIQEHVELPAPTAPLLQNDSYCTLASGGVFSAPFSILLFVWPGTWHHFLRLWICSNQQSLKGLVVRRTARRVFQKNWLLTGFCPEQVNKLTKSVQNWVRAKMFPERPGCSGACCF